MINYVFSITHDTKKGPFPLDGLDELTYVTCLPLEIKEDGKQEIKFSIDPLTVGPDNILMVAYNLGAYVESLLILQDLNSSKKEEDSTH